MVLRVGVIGAGAAGLVALRHLISRPEFSAIGFELGEKVGGTWLYTETTGQDQHGDPIHASMYKNLVTNLPKEVMAFPDFPFNSSLPSFVRHEQVQEYLESYAEHYKLNDKIQFLTRVDHVTKIPDSVPDKWEVKVSKVGNNSENNSQTFHFDSVIICNGHYSVPLVPDIPGLDIFRGRVIHSHNYRHPEDFKGEKVAVVGAGASGQDIMLDIAPHASQVYLCHRKPRLESRLPGNITQHSSIESVGPEVVTLEDGSSLNASVILLCTGYRYTFPFLSRECHPNVTEERLTPLYQHLIHIRHPSLAFIGIPKTVCPFPMFDTQVRFFLASLTGEMVLPSVEEMLRHEGTEFDMRRELGMPARHAHHMGTLQWEYNDRLAALASFRPLPPAVRDLYNHVHTVRRSQLPSYKQLNYKLINTEAFTEI